MDSSKKLQIRNLLGVMLSGILIACFFSSVLLYKYSPSGQYKISNVMLSPNIIESLNFNDSNSKTKTISRFVFDKIEFEYDDLQKGKLKSEVSNDQYTIFYEEVKSDKSLKTVSDEMKNSFNKGRLAKLKILIRTESGATWQAMEKSFQEIDFSPQGNYYRVQLRESDSAANSNYAYFEHSSIFNDVINLFSKKDGL